mgnify:CR=1 FL=1
MTEEFKSIAFIDGQNLHLGTRESGWSVDHHKLRIYLRDKYKITEAYYFLGFIKETEQDLYDALQKSAYILSFREHSSVLIGKKKGNVDSDIIFTIMKKLVEKEPIGKIFIISGDGDYIKLVNFLMKRNVFGKMLFPNKKFASSLYNKLGREHFDFLEEKDIRAKIEYMRKNNKVDK